MKRFLILIAVFFTIVVIIDVAFGAVCRYLNIHAKGGDTANHYNITAVQESPVIILGSSRAIHHYNPAILEDSLGMGVYNCGVDGNGILFQYGRLAMMLKRYKPEIIIYDAITSFDMAPDDNTKYLGWLKRWYGDPAIDSIFIDIAPVEKIKLMSNLYRYNGAFISMLSDNIKPLQEVSYHGYKPLGGVINYTPDTEEEAPVEWQNLKLKYFRKMIEVCRENNIKLVVVYSPWFKKRTSESYRHLTELCKQNDIPTLDYYGGSAFNEHPEFFTDDSHLNSVGADAFSAAISHRLKLLVKHK